MPPFVGNTIRGAFSTALYENSKSAFNAVFKTEPVESAPNSYVISTPYPSKIGYVKGDNGIVGSVRYKGDITKYLPYIDLGSQIHIGKKTTRGCGEYEFEF